MDAKNSRQAELWKWYVYELRDPDTLDVFYVGKGCDHRLESHDANDTSEKGLRIFEIQRRGKEPKRVIIGRFEDERQAFAVEATLIKWVYGKNALTNAVQGHGHKFIRPKVQLEEKTFSSIEGVDIPIKAGSSFMELLEFNRALDRLRERTPRLAEAIADFTEYLIEFVSTNFKDVSFAYRSTKTRISFFLGPPNAQMDLSKKLPGTPICRIFFRSALCINGQMHVSFERDTSESFVEEATKDFFTRLGEINGQVSEGKVDLIITNPANWRSAKGKIDSFVEKLLRHKERN